MVYRGQIVGQEQANAALRGYELRRLIMERMGAKREMMGWIKRHTGTIEECRHRLKSETELTLWQRLDLDGRMEIAQARRWTCEQNIQQYDLEIGVYLAMLR